MTPAIPAGTVADVSMPPLAMQFFASRFALTAGLLAATMAVAQPVPMRGLAFTDHRQQPLDAAALRGHWVLLHFVFTTCSTTCPLQVQELAALQQALPEDLQARLRIVSMTVDPLQDTPKSLAAFARAQGADRAGWHFVTGRPAEVHVFLDRMQALAPGDRRPESHRTSLYLYDPRGELVQRYAGTPLDRPRLVAELSRLLSTR